MSSGHALAGGQDVEALVAFGAEEVPAALEVADQAVRLVLRRHGHAPYARVQGVRQGEVDDAQLAAEIHGGLGAAVGQLHQAAAASAREDVGHGVARRAGRRGRGGGEHRPFLPAAAVGGGVADDARRGEGCHPGSAGQRDNVLEGSKTGLCPEPHQEGLALPGPPTKGVGPWIPPLGVSPEATRAFPLRHQGMRSRGSAPGGVRGRSPVLLPSSDVPGTGKLVSRTGYPGSYTNTTVASGGSNTSAEAGRPCAGCAPASTPPRLPSPEPP